MKEKIIVWLYTLLGGSIGSGAASVSAWLGMTAAKSIGIDVPFLNFKSIMVIFVSGFLTHAFMYLKKSPLPNLFNGFDTAPPFKDARAQIEVKPEPPKE